MASLLDLWTAHQLFLLDPENTCGFCSSKNCSVVFYSMTQKKKVTQIAGCSQCLLFTDNRF